MAKELSDNDPDVGHNWYICLNCRKAVYRYSNLRKCPKCGATGQLLRATQVVKVMAAKNGAKAQ